LSTVQKLRFQTFLPIRTSEAWLFFSDPRNLKTLTPDTLNMQILSEESLPKEIYEGLIICYQINLSSFIKSHWVTEITHLTELKSFVDEQRFGPYTFWHHQHIFHEEAKGTLMEDIIHYKVPGGIVGHFLLSSYISNQLKKIFDYRTKKMEELFKRESL
jgi:ligand-binding SRPBCC domain-containing protein